MFIFVAVMLKWKNDGTAAIEEMPDRHTDFEKIIEGNYLYVDKTEYVYRMVHGASIIVS